MDNQHDALDQGQSRGQGCVEDDGEADDGDGQQGAVPGLVFVQLVVQDDQALDDGADNEGDAGEVDLPPGRAEPSFGQE